MSFRLSVRALRLAVLSVVVLAVGVNTTSGRAASPAVGPGKPPAPLPWQVPAPPPGPHTTTIPVPEYHQQHPLSCEESALSMVLAFYGHPAGSGSASDQKAREDQILHVIGIDRRHYWAGAGSTETDDQRKVAGDPFEEYVGDVDGSERLGVQTGYGTYFPTIAHAARRFDVPVKRAGHVDPDDVYETVRDGRPVEVWMSYDLQPHDRDDYRAADGRRVPYAGPWEHTMIVTGIDRAHGLVRVNDPDRFQYWITTQRFETAYAVYGHMAVVFGSQDRADGDHWHAQRSKDEDGDDDD